MSDTELLLDYTRFVDEVTSDASKDSESFVEALDIIEETSEVPPERLITAALGICAEGGEFTEVVKKCIFQGKPMDEHTIYHMKRELGDIMWYWMNSCSALGIDPNDVIAENVKKLEKRYPGGSFDPYYSENRKDGDI